MYKLSKALLCEQSPYFAATFNGKFKEDEDQSTILEEVDGVVTIRSFQMLVQWLYSHRVVFGDSSPEETITLILEFVRLADMCEVTGMESLMAEQVKGLILANTGTNGCCINLQHVASAASLPQEHLVRGVFAAAAVKEFFHHDDSQFIDTAKEDLHFSADLLRVMKATFKSFTHTKRGVTFKDPLSGERTELRFNRASIPDVEFMIVFIGLDGNLKNLSWCQVLWHIIIAMVDDAIDYPQRIGIVFH